MLLYFIYFLNSQGEGEKASTYAFWHINSSQWRERGKSMVPNPKSRQAVLTSSKLQSAPGTNKKRQFREILFSYSIPEERESSQENPNSLAQIDLVSAATWGGHTVRKQPILQACRDWKGLAATWSFNLAQRQGKLLTPAGQNGPARILLKKTLKRSQYDRFEFCSPFCRVSLDSPSLP